MGIRNITACKRCRQKRIKCDKKFPKCSNCVRKNEECLSIDVGTGEVVNRSYVYELENKVDDLKRELAFLKGSQSLNILQEGKLNSDITFDIEHGQVSIENGSSNSNLNYKMMLMGETEISKIKNLQDDELPPIVFAEDSIRLYFKISNVQLPILHRNYFLMNYFKPLYGRIDKILWKDLVGKEYQENDLFPVISLDRKRKCLFFLYIILAISTSLQQHHHPLSLSYYYQQQAFKYVDTIWQSNPNNEICKIEKMQSLLLLSAYSLMRPSNPGGWYLIGNAIRLMYDLGLNEDPEVLGDTDIYLIDMKRRMYWCCYSMDRQISSYFRKPFGMNDKLTVKFPSLVNDNVLLLGRNNNSVDNTKLVMVQYFELRILQNDIYLATDLSSKDAIHSRLMQWWDTTLTIVDIQFDKLILEVVYHQSIVNLYKFILFEPELSTISQDYFQILFKSCCKVIDIYYYLQNDAKLLNYSWVSINNIFLSGTTYLFEIYYCESIRNGIVVEELETICNKVEIFLSNLKNICFQQCLSYIKNFKELKNNVLDLINHERSSDINLEIFDDTEFINLMVGSVNAEEFSLI